MCDGSGKCSANGIKVRKAGEGDITVMAGLLEDLFSVEKDFNSDRPKQEEGLRLFLSCEGRQAFVAEMDGKVAGMVTGQMLASTAEGALSVLLEDLVTDPGHRGRGIGSHLLAAVEDWGREKGAARLQLLADKDNAPAREFYEKAGWERTNLVCLKKTKPGTSTCTGMRHLND